ncbi:MAG: polysaccharide pyruvyl transferase family protein [Lachnospiraceae bacterium]|nr:polysaccharide pyruvyl transferase family protein [Lachnospiraceae bacterium]
MKTVAIITHYHYGCNYGGILQAYALRKYIEDLGYDAKVIDYAWVQSDILHTNNDNFKFVKVLKRKFNTLISLIKKYMQIYYFKSGKIRNRKFEEFREKQFKTTEFVNKDSINKLSEKYDFYIAGSDQVWNPMWFDPNFFLAFVGKDKRKIAYAASIGVSKLSEYAERKMKPLIDDFYAVSLREEQGVQMINRFSATEAVNVLDPTLLLTEKQWDNVNTNLAIKDKYIFCYFLGGNKENRALAEKVAKKYGLKIVSLPCVADISYEEFKWGDIRIFDAGPAEFIGLVDNSEFVITDSFHGTIFSIIKQKKFVVLKRNLMENSSSMNSRVVNLLKMVGLESRLVSRIDKIEEVLNKDIDYDTVEMRIDAKRKQSEDFLVKALS